MPCLRFGMRNVPYRYSILGVPVCILTTMSETIVPQPTADKCSNVSNHKGWYVKIMHSGQDKVMSQNLAKEHNSLQFGGMTSLLHLTAPLCTSIIRSSLGLFPFVTLWIFNMHTEEHFLFVSETFVK